MTITTNGPDSSDVVTIAIKGRFDFNSLQEFRNSYEKINPKPTKFIVDLKESDYLDSSALGMLLALRDYAGNKNNVSIINCNPDVKKILLITKLNELFSVE